MTSHSLVDGTGTREANGRDRATPPLDSAVAAFTSTPTTLARREGSAVTAADGPADGVPVADVRRSFAAYDELVDAEGRVAIPLHEPDSAELTGEYLRYSEASLYPAYAYYDTERDRRARVSADRIGETSFAWQLRFWTAAHDPPSPPGYASDGAPTVSAAPAVVHPRVDYSESEAAAFYDRLCEFVSDLRSAERADHRDAYARLSYGTYRRRFGGVPAAVPIRHVDAPAGARCTALVPDDLVDADVTTDFDLYPETEVLVDVRNPEARSLPGAQRAALPAEAELTDVDGDALSMRLLPDRNAAAAGAALRSVFDGDGTLRVASLHNPVPYDRERAAIRTVRETPAKRELVTGNAPVRFDPAGVDAAFEGLNESQTRAARRALAAERVTCIHGPPGTGKTRTLVALVRAFVDAGCRVLACAHSNQATDNLLVGTSTPGSPDPDSLHAAARNGEFELARAGSGTTNPVVASAYDTRSAADADVVGATTSAAAAFDADAFDVAVLDEASQASIPASLVPFAAAERLVLAGDHRQLPPYAASELEDRETAVSLFEHLLDRYGEDVATMLRTQYRMHRDIAAFPSERFYDGRLETAARNRDWQLGSLAPVVAYDVEGPETSARGHSWRNEPEARVVAAEVRTLLERDVSPGDVGVVTPYRGQIGAVRSALDDLSARTAGLKVDTVDSFQGGEREAIVVSFVRSNPEGTAGFLTHPDEGPRRLNVALTRARKRLALVGDWETLCAPASGEASVETYRALRDWLEDESAFRSPPEPSC